MVAQVNEHIAVDDIRIACEEILASPGFAKAHRMRRLLRFLVEQAVSRSVHNTIEYAIGIEVFDRDPATYSPGDDATVRVQVGRLRQRLDGYYSARGAVHGLEIQIPIGSYMPVIRRVSNKALAAVQHGTLAFHPIRCIAGTAAGEAFACGLQEELVAQLWLAFGDVVLAPAMQPFDVSRSADGAPGHCAHHLVEGSIRFDSERSRTSIRLVESSHWRIAWARNFDRGFHFEIGHQEELASSICSALKDYLHA